MIKFDSKCPDCGETTIVSTNSLIICNNCGYAPNGKKTIKCPICDNYNYKMNDGFDICNTCCWEFDKSKINEDIFRNEWMQRQQNFSAITTSIKESIKEYFSRNRVGNNSQSFYEIIIRLYNYLSKVTLPQKYTVKLSNEIINKTEFRDLITLFKAKFENRENVIPWQSSTVFDSNYQDILFNHWNIKHLHLIEDSEQRSGNTLLYIQNDTTVYFLDVVNHPRGAGWNNLNILRTVCQNNWMQHIGFYKISDSDSLFVEGSLEPKIENEEEIRKLYKCGVNMGFTIDGISYSPNPIQGVVTSGDNIKIIVAYKKLYKQIEELSSYEFVCFEPDFFSCLGRITYKRNGIEHTEQLSF